MGERTSEWPSTLVWILGYSGPQCEERRALQLDCQSAADVVHPLNWRCPYALASVVLFLFADDVSPLLLHVIALHVKRI